MIPVDQTTFGDPGGDCFSACVASLMHLTIDQVPYFMGDTDWYARFEKWLAAYALYPLCLVSFQYDERFHGFYIMGGKSPRGNFQHSVIAKRGMIVHDPHPSRAGLISVQRATLLVPFSPQGLAHVL